MLTDRSQLPGVKRLVVKVGSSSVTGANVGQIDQLVDALAAARRRGSEVILVTSGAIATGMPLLNLEVKPDDLPTSQALASVGQSRLMYRYQQSLERHDLIAGQILLTSEDITEAQTRNNARGAIDRLLELGVLPIVNENDTTATTEIRFGDNDKLAAMVAVLVEADALVLLSDVDALYDAPPGQPGAKRIDRVDDFAQLEGAEIGGSSTGVGSGGAVTKVNAAHHAADAGVSVLLTSTSQVAAGLAGEAVGTWFQAKG
jgi:glutamate 5-kinase